MTLTSDLFFQSLPEEERELVTDLIFKGGSREIWDKPWMKGEISYKEVINHLSQNMRYTAEQLESILINDIKKMRLNPVVWDFACKVKSITAIATINTDIFTKYVIPELNLNRHFGLIVNSSDFGISDKMKLCDLILEHYEIPQKYNRCLLIDDSKSNIDRFIQLGGHGYLYKDDNEFGKWLENQSIVDV